MIIKGFSEKITDKLKKYYTEIIQQKFEKEGLNIILDYPLTINNNLEDYYNKLGLNYSLKNDF